ncbi:MAG TPA: diphthine synthase [Candidatus Sulfotelmatobacter sp.]|nr:diphthine synthase [Candidatus Sulfotelmatobacter sp.]
MKQLIFVGLGLNDEKGISLHGLEETRNADTVFMELYTNLLPEFSLKQFEALSTKKVNILSRSNLEEENGKIVLDAAKNGNVVFLVPGDPFVATTHVALRIEAEKRGIKTRVIHGASAISAVIGVTGLHNYKFGKTVTIPFSENSSETPYNVIAQNKMFGLHTLCLLDLRANEERFLSINEGIKQLLAVEEKKAKRVFTPETLAIGVARVGSQNQTAKADWAEQLIRHNFGGPPQTLIVPGELHFMEAEALIRFTGAPQKLRGGGR